MNQLSPRLRTAIQLRDLCHFSIREAATVEGVNVSVIKSRIFRARRKLVDLLDAGDLNL
jgi:DNA-directed RNA polymerase specialized sigma24 family protein